MTRRAKTIDEITANWNNRFINDSPLKRGSGLRYSKKTVPSGSECVSTSLPSTGSPEIPKPADSSLPDIAEMWKMSCILGRMKAGEDLGWLCWDLLGFRDLSGFHREVFEALGEGATRYLFLLPRGHLKSSIVTVGYTIQRVIRDPNIRVLIDSSTWENARSFLRSIRGHLTSKRMQEIFPVTFTTDNQDSLTLSTRENKSLKEPTIDTSGVEKTKTSQHYDLIIADDIVVRENVGTEEQIEKVKLHYKDLLDLLEPNGTLIIVGTRWHYTDLYGDIIEHESDRFKVMVKKAVDGDKILFPKKFTKAYLDELRSVKGTYEFSAQYLNEPVDSETAHFKQTDLRFFDKLPDNLTFFCAFDPAFSQKDQADYTAGVAIATDDSVPYNIYIDSYVHERMTAGGVIDSIYSMRDRYNPVGIGLEANAAQKVLYEFLLKDARYGKGVGIRELRPDSDKFRRILKLQPFFEAHRIFIRREMKDLINELIRFPLCGHDDIIDALAYAVQMTFQTSKRAIRSTRNDVFPMAGDLLNLNATKSRWEAWNLQ